MLITRTIEAIHQWLSGPPLAAQDRIRRDIAQESHKPFASPMGGA